MFLVSSFIVVLQELALVMTAPSFHNFVTILTGRSLEVAFHDSKQHLGFEEPPGWSRRAAQRTAPVALLLYSLIVSWFAQEGHRHYRPQTTSWYTKPHASFGDMLAPLRRESLREQSFRWGLSGPGSQKILETLENTLALAGVKCESRTKNS